MVLETTLHADCEPSNKTTKGGNSDTMGSHYPDNRALDHGTRSH